jgi:ATP-binding cassette subfamily B protein/ATP-binding cassette subfamily C protein/ATP-binding cassette subfamily B multidrug efflux pump
MQAESLTGNTAQAPLDKGQAFRLLIDTAWPERRHVAVGACWLFIAALCEAAGPVLGKFFIDNHLLPRNLDIPTVALLLGGALGLGWAASVLRYVQLTRLAGVAMRSVQRLRERVYGHVMALPMAFFDRAITGQLVSRVTNDTEAVKTLYVQVLFVMLESTLTVAGAMMAMAWLDWRLMGIVTLLIPAVVIIVLVYQRISAPAVARARALRSEINAQVAESIAGMAVLQAANAEVRFNQRFSEANRQFYAARLRELSANAWLLRPMLDLLNVLLVATVIYAFGAHRFNGLEVGLLYAFVSYIARVVEPLIQITLQFSQLQQSVVAAARVNVLLQETRTTATPDTALAHLPAGALQIEGVRFGYLPEQPVLHDLKLSIAPGEFVGIVGHTGSGKSTLLSLLLRFYTPQAGAIRIDGQPLDALPDTLFRREVGLIPQEPFLLAASVRENIDMGRGLSDAEIEAAARAAHCHDFILALEAGYDTPLSEGGARLSVGQKQLIAIARALAGQPRILLLDEATSHIDSETEQIVQTALTALHGRVTMIAIAHRLSTIRDADRIVVLNHGRIAEQGPHDALMAIEGGIYQRLYLLQQIAD